MHQIGEVAERVGLSLRTVRYYEEMGLITPEKRTDGGFRLYTDANIDRLLLVMHGRAGCWLPPDRGHGVASGTA